MDQLKKPSNASWTEQYPELGTGLVSYEDSISPEFYELEREAIFKRAWLNVGRVEELPRNGSYFTKELPPAKASVIVVARHGGQDPRLPQRMQAPRQQAGLGGHSPQRDEWLGPAVRLQVPRLALRARRHVQLRPPGEAVLRSEEIRFRSRSGALRHVGRLHLREPGPRAPPASEGILGPDDHSASMATHST